MEHEYEKDYSLAVPTIDIDPVYKSPRGTTARVIWGKDWSKLLPLIGLPPVGEIDDKTKVGKRFLPVSDFKKALGIPGRMPGYYTLPGVFLAGGSLLSWLAGINPKDRDYFGGNLQDCQNMVAFLEMQGYEFSGHVGDYKPEDNDPVLNTKNIASWYLGEKGEYLPSMWHAIPNEHAEAQEHVRALNFVKPNDSRNIMQQVILLIKGTPQQVIDTFDISISQIACDGESIYWGEHTIQDLVRGRMRICRVHHPMSTVRRVIKYSTKGFWPCNGTILDMCNHMSEYANEREANGLDPLTDSVISLD